MILFAGALNAIAGVLSMSTKLSSTPERDVTAALASAGAKRATTIRSPQRDAMAVAGAYAVGATVPLLRFAIAGEQRRIRSGIEMVAPAAGAGLLGYLVGVVAPGAFGLDFSTGQRP